MAVAVATTNIGQNVLRIVEHASMTKVHGIGCPLKKLCRLIGQQQRRSAKRHGCKLDHCQWE